MGRNITLADFCDANTEFLIQYLCILILQRHGVIQQAKSRIFFHPVHIHAWACSCHHHVFRFLRGDYKENKSFSDLMKYPIFVDVIRRLNTLCSSTYACYLRKLGRETQWWSIQMVVVHFGEAYILINRKETNDYSLIFTSLFRAFSPIRRYTIFFFI